MEDGGLAKNRKLMTIMRLPVWRLPGVPQQLKQRATNCSIVLP